MFNEKLAKVFRKKAILSYVTLINHEAITEFAMKFQCGLKCPSSHISEQRHLQTTIAR